MNRKEERAAGGKTGRIKAGSENARPPAVDEKVSGVGRKGLPYNKIAIQRTDVLVGVDVPGDEGCLYRSLTLQKGGWRGARIRGRRRNWSENHWLCDRAGTKPKESGPTA